VREAGSDTFFDLLRLVLHMQDMTAVLCSSGYSVWDDSAHRMSVMHVNSPPISFHIFLRSARPNRELHISIDSKPKLVPPHTNTLTRVAHAPAAAEEEVENKYNASPASSTSFSTSTSWSSASLSTSSLSTPACRCHS
jgi:hypothetical protein